MLELKNLNAGYGPSQVLFDLTMNVNDHEIVSIVGRNGVGKTSTLKAVMGLIQTMSGSIRFDSAEISTLPTYRRGRLGMAYVPDDRGIFVNITAAENLRIPLIGHKSEKKNNNLDLVLNLFPILKERWNQKAGTLSGGEQQMLTIARGLVVRPKLLMLDEISEGLAPEVIMNCCAAFHKLKSETAILIAEQDVRVALEISDRVYVMLNGSIAFHGTVAQVREEQAIEKYIHL
jgi:ABC-type branched-subunit amino acid transport system ATPase component